VEASTPYLQEKANNDAVLARVNLKQNKAVIAITDLVVRFGA
jgi:hypothetical protein